MNKYTRETFIAKVSKIHNNKYDYSKSDYVNNQTKIIIICPIHGEFTMTPQKHLGGQGCKKCGYLKNSKTQSSNKEIFVKKASEIHNNKYDYSKTDYINNRTKVCIICPEHGEFWQTPNSHLNGRGCKKCGVIQRTLKQRSTTEQFIEKAREIHCDKYDYSIVQYNNNNTKVSIICPKHGKFMQAPTHHLRGEGCPKCKYESIAQKQFHSLDFILSKFKDIHNNKYDYSKVAYNGVDRKVCIICPEHGEFWQEPWVHIKGCGCPKCGVTLSKNEDEIIQFLQNELGENAIEIRNRTILGNKQEIDIVIPSKNVCIEYNGLLWHSEKFKRITKDYHLRKTEVCEAKGYRLIHIFEDEYVNHKNIVLAKLKHILHLNNNLPVVNARQTNVRKIDMKDAKIFLNNNHIQGYVAATVHIGAFFQEQLVAVMSFKQITKNSDDWELIRFATDINYRHRGTGGKLFNFFIKQFNPKTVKSFADRRWTALNENNLYVSLGFTCIEILKPDYRYYDSKKGKIERIHKFNCRKQILHKKYGLPLSMTEKEMTEELKMYRIYDCGLIKYVWTSKKNDTR